MEELLSRHRNEQRELQARITQKKKSASKKTRKGVNEECDGLERELKQTQQQEINELNGVVDGQNGHLTYGLEPEDSANPDEKEKEKTPNSSIPDGNDLEEAMSDLSVSSQSTKKPPRQKARLARRAAEQARLVEEAAAEAANIPDQRAIERDGMEKAFKGKGLEEKVIRPDGHCLYAAVADQLRQRGDDPKIVPAEGKEEGDYRFVRYAAADYMSKHPDDFIPFLEEDLQSYVTKLRNTGEWGGQIELTALSKAYKLKICVLEADGSVVESDGAAGQEDKEIWLAYYRHGFGLGEHYNSLRKQAT